jgi:hypothetical protein
MNLHRGAMNVLDASLRSSLPEPGAEQASGSSR